MKLVRAHFVFASVIGLGLVALLQSQRFYQCDEDSSPKQNLLPLVLFSVFAHNGVFCDYNLMRNLIFVPVLLLQAKGALSVPAADGTKQYNIMETAQRLMQQQDGITKNSHFKAKPSSSSSQKPNSLLRTSTRLEPIIVNKKSASSIIARKKELSNRILEEIENLDPLKCLPKALCGLSAQSALRDRSTLIHQSDSSGYDPSEKNSHVVSEYLDLMKTIITMKRVHNIDEESNALPSTQLARPQTTTRNENDAEDEDEEDDTGESAEDYIRDRDRWYYKEKHQVQKLLATTENINDPNFRSDFDFPERRDEQPPKKRKQGTRKQQKNRRQGHGLGGEPPVSYSQQYHYQSMPGPGYGDYPPQPTHEFILQPSLTSMLYYFLPTFIKQFFHKMFPGTFHLELTPYGLHNHKSPSVFADDPFFDGFKKSSRRGLSGHGQFEEPEYHYEEDDTREMDNNRMLSRRSSKSRPRSLNEILVDARERFSGAIEVGETFRSTRKCQAVYSVCPFQHGEIIQMIDVLKKKLRERVELKKTIAAISNVNLNDMMEAREDTSSTRLTVPQEQLKVGSRKSYSLKAKPKAQENLFLNRYPNKNRKPLVIRNINRILHTEPSSSRLKNNVPLDASSSTTTIDKNAAANSQTNSNENRNRKELEHRQQQPQQDYYSNSPEPDDLLAVESNTHKAQTIAQSIHNEKISTSTTNTNNNRHFGISKAPSPVDGGNKAHHHYTPSFKHSSRS